MDAPRQTRTWPGYVFAFLVLVLALGNAWVGAYPYGSAVWVRPLLSLCGIAGAVCLVRGNAWWTVLLPVWSLLQTWVIATDVSGQWFFQGLNFTWKQAAWTRMSGMVVAYHASGFNLAGPLLFAALLAITGFHWHPAVRRPISRKAAIIAGLVLISLAGGKGVAVWRDHQAEAVLDLDLPRVPVYYRAQLLGRTPLRITPELVRAQHLPLNPARRLKLDITGWVDCVLLSDGSNTIRLQAGVPPWFAGKADTFETPWGRRSRMHCGLEEGNRRSGFIYPRPDLRNEPVLTIRLRDPQPLKAGAPVRLHCELKNPTGTNYAGVKAVVSRRYFLFDREPPGWAAAMPNARWQTTMPESWRLLPPGATREADLEFDGPTRPGDYEFFCDWFLNTAGTGQNTGPGSAYSNIIRLRVD